MVLIIHCSPDLTRTLSNGDEFEEDKELKDVSILDIAPTIAEIMSLDVPREWEGKSIVLSF